jgi:hypothetical protein
VTALLAAACLALAAGASPRAAPPATVAAEGRSVEELAEAQVREREAVLDARERRARAGAERLDVRVAAALDQGRRLEDRDRQLAAREQQLDLREQRIPAAGAPTAEQRQLEALEGQLATQERQLVGQERSFVPAVDAAARRERDAALREGAELREPGRAARVPGGATSAVERRRKAADDLERDVSAHEERLAAMGDRLEAFERQLRARAERLEARSRRLDARARRLELLEQRAAAMSPPPAAAPPPRPAEPRAPAPRERMAIAVVVKAPTALVRGRSPGAAPSGAGGARHPGLTVDRAVAAATVVSYPTQASSLSELDVEAVDRIAKLAARERCELLLWARARDASALPEAERRASELRTRVLAAGPLDGRQVVTRLTTRAGAPGVDVVVSALRDAAGAAGAGAPGPSRPPAAALEAGESGKRQVREAVQAAQASMEPCLGDHLEARKLRRAAGFLKLEVTAAGTISRLESGGDLAGTEVEECLGRAAARWALPGGDAGYAVDLPLAVFRGAAGARP